MQPAALSGADDYFYTYTYDEAGRLTVVADGTNAVHYDLDANGNRLRRAVMAIGTTTPTSEEFGDYDVQGRLTQYDGKTYVYTPRGTLSTITEGSAVTTFTYDLLGNLRTVAFSNPSLPSIEYVVDGENRRVGKKVNGTLRKAWIYEDALRIAAEFDFDFSGTPLKTKRFGYGTKSNVPDLMVIEDLTATTTTRYRIVSDYLGSVRMVVSESGGPVLTRMDFDEFGKGLIQATKFGVDEVPFGLQAGC